MREYKLLELINLRQNYLSSLIFGKEMWVWVIWFDFTKLSKYYLSIVVNPKATISNIWSGVCNIVVKEFHTAMIFHDMHISYFMFHTLKIEK